MQYASSSRFALAAAGVLLAWLFGPLGPATASPAPDQRDSIAVIVGNNTYAGGVPAVDFAHNDADAMRRFVIERLGYRVGNIIDLRDATKAQLEATFGNGETHKGKLFSWIRPGESDVFVFYSGHGVPGLSDRRSYLLPVDGDPNLAEITGYPLDQLYKNLSRIGARAVTVFIDACFSGETPRGMLIRSASGISVEARVPVAGEKLTVLTAAEGNQVASWDEAAKHGLFTRHLLDALQGAADGDAYGNRDGDVTVDEVRRYLDDEMTYWARRIHGRDQRATVEGDGATVLARYTPGTGPTPTPPVVADTTSPVGTGAAPASGVRVSVLDDVLFVRGTSSVNVRAAPGTRNEMVGILPPGAAVAVTGKVEGLDWYQVTLVGGTAGYVFAPLLGRLERLLTHSPAPPPPDYTVAAWPIQVSSLVFDHGLGRKDRRYVYRTIQHSLERSRGGVTSTWRNPVSGNSGSITPVRNFHNAYGQSCRVYSQSVAYLGALVRHSRQTACREPNGTWSIVH